MRALTTEIDGKTAVITYPSVVSFGFNPLYCRIETEYSIKEVIVRMSDKNGNSHEIAAKLLDGCVNIYISKILQLFFDNPLYKRSLDLNLMLKYNETPFFSTELLVIWGGISLGDRFASMGHFSDASKGNGVVRRIWFTKFPFQVSLFSTEQDAIVNGMSDGNVVLSCGTYKANKHGIFELQPSRDFPGALRQACYRLQAGEIGNVFDDTFDYTFYSSSIGATSVTLDISKEEAGYYLRWIDSKGCLQYFLFTKGVISLKTKKSSVIIDTQDELHGSMWYVAPSRDIHYTATKSCKCCAVSLPCDIYEYVVTIATSPHVDLYLGRTSAGKDIWLPVNMDDCTVTYNPKEQLHDLEVSFSLPESNTQTL